MAPQGLTLARPPTLGQVVGHRLIAFGSWLSGKSLAVDLQRDVPRQLLQEQQNGQLPSLPAGDPYAGGDFLRKTIRQELAPIIFNPFGFQNPQAVVNAIVQHTSGQFQQSGQLSQALLCDPKISGPLRIRCNALVGLPFDFEPVNDSPDAKDLADTCRAHWRAWFPASEHAKFHRDLIVMGFTRGQMLWGPNRKDANGNLFRHPDIHAWMPGQYLWWYWDPARNFGRWLESDTEGVREPVPGNGDWIFAAMAGKQPYLEGHIMALGLRFAMRLSIALSLTRFATALASGHNVFASPVQLDGASQAFIRSQLGNPDNLDLLLPGGSTDNRWLVSWVGPNSSGASELFEKALQEYGRECSEEILGQNLTTEVGSTGSHAAIKGAELVRQDVLEFDAGIEQTLCREQILKPIAAMNFNDAELAPVMTIQAKPPADLAVRADALSKLSTFLQVVPPDVNLNALLREFGLQLVESAEDQAALRDRQGRPLKLVATRT